MKIYLVRHGEAKEMEGKSSLTTQGLLESKALAKELIKFSFSKVYSSDKERAKDTAKEYLLLSNHQNYLETDKLREIYRVLIGGPPKEGTPKERASEDKKRADEIWDTLSNEKDDLLVFAHGNLIRYFLNKIMKRDENLWKNLPIYSGSISVIEINGPNMEVIMINQINHLPNPEVDKSNKTQYIE